MIAIFEYQCTVICSLVGSCFSIFTYLRIQVRSKSLGSSWICFDEDNVKQIF